ncbi:hypothetical protein [Streptomyces sp. NBC_00199]|uniref:hypothetical protein n=1 Tax=Streptomyces sp. NBC_00199 TaxID=2975678 RepID=UPI00225A26A2|nr:hypothetical protein [Streptomyces sp. NBC_00199]MCX5266050.1 hypothetical protein [Streptomyces sp. NBC_00199]
MMRRRTQVTSLVLLLVGTSGGTFGMITDHQDAGRLGIALAMLAGPLLICHSIRVAQHVSEEQLADAHNAGYRLALEHVARGLLDPPEDPQPGHAETENRAGRGPGNVIPMRPQRIRDAGDGPKRKAQ